MVRQMMRFGPEVVSDYDLSSLRATVSSGEPWNEDSWIWFFKHVCRERIPILNSAGGTELGGAILIGTLHDPCKPCAFGGTVPGVGADIVTSTGAPVPRGEAGELVLRRPSMGITRGLWQDQERFFEAYWSQIPGVWVQGDYARQDEDGLWSLLGRSDDTIKIAGKRTGPSELESMLAESGFIVEAAIVGIPDPVTGSALACAAVLADNAPAPELAARQLSALLAASAGAAFRPAYFVFIDQLPRTRNQKIMRRVVRAALLNQDAGNLAALLNPEAVEALCIATRFDPRSDKIDSTQQRPEVAK
jgi:acetyl-CoA synthetase